MNMKKLFLFAAILLLFFGCALFEEPDEMEKSAQELVSEGSFAFASEKYRAAIKAFTDLINWFPFSQHAILAELKIADAHYNLKEYDEAVFAYEDFEKMHPKNEAVPYVIYQMGLCWFNQLDTIDRDNTPAKNSLDLFKRLINRFPASEYVNKAKENIKKCIANLAGHDLYVADFYMKTKKYKAALKRYESIIENYPNSKESKQALIKIPECQTLLDKK